MLIRLADICYRRRRLVLLGWFVALFGVFALGSAFPADYRASYQTPGAEATEAYELLGERFPSQGGDSVNVVFKADDGIDEAGVQADVESLLAELAAVPHVASVVSPYDEAGANQVSTDAPIAYATVNFDGTFDSIPIETTDEIIGAVENANRDGLQVDVSSLVNESSVGSEAIGLLFAVFVLLLAFGSVLAMGLPLLTAVFGLAIGSTLGVAASHIFETPEWASTVAVMIGLGVGIDYALFIITRYRSGLSAGMSPREATATAMGTAGRAVLFAGGTVVISLLGMLTMGLSYLHGVAASAVIAVLVVLAASLTLLPAMLGFVGRTIDRLKVPFTGRADHQGEHAFWYRWSRIVQRRPWPAFVGGAAVLLLLTVPLFDLRFGFPDDGNNATDQTSRRAYDLLSEGFGDGYNGPLVLVVDLRGAEDTDAVLASLTESAQATDGVDFATEANPNPDGDAAIINVYPETKPQESATETLVHTLRDEVIPAAVGDSGVEVKVGGFTAVSIDQSNYISERLPLFIGAVVLLSFLLLMTVFRSPLVALKAAIMNLLSIAAAYGVMSYAVSGSWFGDLLNIPETPVPAFIPMIMFAILFGLSMDYEVFLLSRIREEYLRTGDNGALVADGLAATARVITAAAAIMVFVFGVFIFDPSVFIKQIGLGLATAVLVDATIVRMVLVPATMELLGDANWWMPTWLSRLLPEVHIEGADAVEAELAALLADEGASV